MYRSRNASGWTPRRSERVGGFQGRHASHALSWELSFRLSGMGREESIDSTNFRYEADGDVVQGAALAGQPEGIARVSKHSQEGLLFLTSFIERRVAFHDFDQACGTGARAASKGNGLLPIQLECEVSQGGAGRKLPPPQIFFLHLQ